MNILDEIVEYKKIFVKKAIDKFSLDQLKKSLDLKNYKPKNLSDQQGLKLIAEIKRKSPSKGLIRKDFDPQKIAQDFATKKTSAISVLTDEKYFGGSKEIFKQVKKVVDLPLLRKEFIIDAYQIWESKYLQADVILLIARILSSKQILEFIDLALSLDLSILLEFHDHKEITKFNKIYQKIENVNKLKQKLLFGVNNRNLETFNVNLQKCIQNKEYLPVGHKVVAESGVLSTQDLDLLNAYKFDFVLIGEGLAKNPELLSWFG